MIVLRIVSGEGACAVKRTRKRPVAAGLVAAAFVVPLMLAACQSRGVPPDTFDLTAPANVDNVAGSTRAQILIVEPSALKSLDSQNIVVKASPTEIEYLAKSQWSDRLPKVVQARLVEAFENTGKVRAVSKPGEGLVIDYQIVTDIRAFQANVGAGSRDALVSLSVKLVSDRTGKVVRSRVFDVAVPLGSTGAVQIVDALNAAFERAASDIVRWVFRAI
ncbi:MAG: membrane integrity-associated transporter subunit PqiC [Nitratireductor sp.]|nr:membrane integrity-associated transporter subunit PqiC [Nitratireductor sp.]MCB1456541.1 membrane integrity-associated transporter subunit PqiC [Nitratireductor sp.]MCB1458557.1 membrane integrity-associated transporter subunit PqiC [Nitratireductor sp.]